MGSSFHFLIFWKYIQNWNENSGSFLEFLKISGFYLMYKLICQKLAHFLSAQMTVMSNFSVIILLEMYNFGWEADETAPS